MYSSFYKKLINCDLEKHKKVYTFIDSSNLWAAQKSKGKMFDYAKLLNYIKKKFQKIIIPNKNDPSKLASIKRRLAEQIECYFVCINTPNIPPDNNKAERALRHLVIKRKKSFGSKTPKGADVMSVLYSVVMSLWYRSKENFFKSYNEALSL